MTPEQRRFYLEQGYLLLPGFFRSDEIDVWLERFRAIVEGEVAPAEHMLVMRDVMVAKGAVTPGCAAEAIAKLQDFENDPVLFSYTKDPRLLDCTARFSPTRIRTGIS